MTTATRTKANFASARKEAEEAGLVSEKGEYLKVKEGDNKIRLLSECLPHPGVYQGKKNFKWLCYVLDRKDHKVKPYFMPHTIYKQIEALQMNDDYAFEDVPMPYDLTINAKGAGTKDVVYTVMPARKNSDLMAVEWAEYEKQKPIAELQAKIKEKRQEESTDSPVSDHDFDPRDHDDEPF